MSWLSKALGLDKPQNKTVLTALNAAGSTLEGALAAQSPEAAEAISIAQSIGSGNLGAAAVTINADQIAKLESSLYNLVTNMGVVIGEQTFDNLVYNTLQQDGAILAAPAASVVRTTGAFWTEAPSTPPSSAAAPTPEAEAPKSSS